MPSKKLSIGSAAATGVDSFLRSYMMMQQMKQKEKLEQNSFIVQVLMDQLKDETVPFRTRAKIIDSIPSLVGIKKTDKRLSEMLGLDEDFLNSAQESEVKGKEGTPSTDLIDSSVTDPSLASSIKLKGTQATNTIPASIEKKGDLSPAIIKRKLLLEARKAEDEQDLDKQTKILRLNYELQKESLKATGFTKEIFRGYDRNGNYIVTMTNQMGEKKDIFLGDVDSEAITKAQISSNKPSRFLQEREKYWLSQTNPETGQNYSEEEANIKALEDANNQFKLKQKTGEAYITSLNQGITGTRPIQPAQFVDDQRAVAERKSILRANVNSIKRQAQDASLDSANKSKQANDHWNNVVEPIKREMQKLLDDGLETTDPEYTRQQARLNTEIERYNDLKRMADDATSRDNSLKSSVTEAEEILMGYESGVAAPSMPTNIRAAIDLVRKNNPEQTRTMSDDAIIKYLRSKGKIQ